MAFPLPPSVRKKMAQTGSQGQQPPPNPMGVEEDEEETEAKVKRGGKPNPLKMWAQTKLGG